MIKIILFSVLMLIGCDGSTDQVSSPDTSTPIVKNEPIKAPSVRIDLPTHYLYSSCIEGYKFLIGYNNDIVQILDYNGKGISC